MKRKPKKPKPYPCIAGILLAFLTFSGLAWTEEPKPGDFALGAALAADNGASWESEWNFSPAVTFEAWATEYTSFQGGLGARTDGGELSGYALASAQAPIAKYAALFAAGGLAWLETEGVQLDLGAGANWYGKRIGCQVRGDFLQDLDGGEDDSSSLRISGGVFWRY